MSHAIADAPVRANRAPMRPRAGAPSAPAQPAKANREDTEATLLVRKVAGIIQVYLIPLTSCWPWAISSIAGADHIVEADNQLCDLAKTEEAFAACGEPPRPAMSDHIPQIAASLRKAMHELSRPLGDLGQQLTALVLVENASNLMARLQAAHAGLPGTIDDLRALATFTGVRPHREQPRPPIPRGPDYEDNLAKAAGATAVIGCNMHGYLLFDSKASLVEFVEKSAAQTACLNVMLAYLVDRHCMQGNGPDGSFLADFASFVSDQVYEHQEAVGALLKAGGAA